ncbi:MAG: cobalamin-independent methionine synthase II family protein [Corynebacterium provencense]|jgi:5-methyltetrahydropteroyltriglutamate--homocysteine methyltransferase|uniref:cobalamin-independent methionine synthase II family protein n=1 Tax=Corynebacterium provencense TaxID=1737425 RepID=UPI00298A01A6|nr:cobalamin-independent methionine synthase II family protein [Corynebacterium provencense]
MADKIRTTHVGSLPRTPELLEAGARMAAGDIDRTEFLDVLRTSVNEVVARQHNLGIDIVNEGEYGHITSDPIDFGAWWSYIFDRFSGLRAPQPGEWVEMDVVRSSPGNVQLTSMNDRRDWTAFREAYSDPSSGCLMGRAMSVPTFVGPVTYTGQEQVSADINLLTTALDAAGHPRKDAFMAAISPGSAARLANEYFASDEEIVIACAEALHEEYRAITDAGFTLQIDAPDLAESWDQINPEPTVADYRAWIRIRIDAINRALRGIPREQVRLHICWGSWHGPHTTDVPFGAIVEECLRAEVSGLTFEGASPRHAHEWRVWSEHQLPENTLIYPGVVCHSTNVVEHPRLVADRILQFTDLVGPENVVASTDCGLGGRLHPQIAWAKLESLVEGAALASREIYGS